MFYAFTTCLSFSFFDISRLQGLSASFLQLSRISKKNSNIFIEKNSERDWPGWWSRKEPELNASHRHRHHNKLQSSYRQARLDRSGKALLQLKTQREGTTAARGRGAETRCSRSPHPSPHTRENNYNCRGSSQGTRGPSPTLGSRTKKTSPQSLWL